MIRVGVSVGSFSASGGGFDADAQAFFDRVTTAGGTLTTTEKNATNQLVLDMKSAGTWSAMKAIYPMVGASAAACAQNLKSSSFTGTFSSGWTFASTGVTPNGVSAYFNTTLAPSGNLTGSSTHVSTYSRSNTSQGVDMGSWFTGYTYGIEMSSNRGGAGALNINTSSAFSVRTGGNNTQGLFIGNRTSNTLLKFIKNTTLLGSETTSVTTSLSTFSLYVAAGNEFGTASAFSNKEYAFSTIGDGLTDTQASNFYTAVQAFQTTLSRNV